MPAFHEAPKHTDERTVVYDADVGIAAGIQNTSAAAGDVGVILQNGQTRVLTLDAYQTKYIPIRRVNTTGSTIAAADLSTLH
jgi:hypothetical protein